MPLAGLCTSSDPSAVITYFVDGAAAASVTCPPVGGDLAITASAEVVTLPQCPAQPEDVGVTITCESPRI